MKIVFFDTETTDLDNKAEVIQFAGFVMNDDFKVIDGFNLFCSTTNFISDGAKKVHGLTEEIVEKNSNGNTLEDWLSYPKYNWMLTEDDVVFIAYNASFDKRLTNQTLVKHGYRSLNFGREVPCVPITNCQGRYNMCMMKAASSLYRSPRYLKLANARERGIPYGDDKLQKQYQIVCKKLNIPTYNAAFHDALYDAFVMMMLFYNNRARLCR